MSTQKPTLAFFGATGGCAANALALALKEGYIVSALARTPQKLSDLLTKEHGLPTVAMNNLSIVQGNAKEVADVKSVLAPEGVPAGLIIVGVGGTPSLQMSLVEPVVIDQPTICEDSCKAILSALRDLRKDNVITESNKPTIVCISTTGLTKKRDVPLELNWMYHYLLSMPHRDKAVMEELVARTSLETGPDAPIDSFIIVRPSLLMDGVSKGMSAVRVGWVEHEAAPGAATGDSPGAAIGRTIRRADVGIWLFENAIRHPAEWKGRCVTLTY